MSKSYFQQSVMGGSPENEVFGYGVYRESLVYLFRLHGVLRAGILATRNLGLRDYDTLFVFPDINTSFYPDIKVATQADFDFFRVCSKYHLP